MRRKTIALIGIVALILFAIAFPRIKDYIKCENLTRKYASEISDTVYSFFHSNDIARPWLDIDAIKIIEFIPHGYAKVYCITKDKASGEVLEFRWQNDKWEISAWDTAWSQSGSADSAVWPYYRPVLFSCGCD